MVGYGGLVGRCGAGRGVAAAATASNERTRRDAALKSYFAISAAHKLEYSPIQLDIYI